MEIREAGYGDEVEVEKLISHLQSTLDFEPDRQKLLDMIKDILAKPSVYVLLAWENDVAVGLLSMTICESLFHVGKIARVDEVVVLEGYRGLGIGSTLIEAAKELAEVNGALEVEVSTEFENDDAQRFYEKHGFGQRRLLMELEFED